MVLVLWRAGFADRPIRIPLPNFRRRPQPAPGEPRIQRPRRPTQARRHGDREDSRSSIFPGLACSISTSRASTCGYSSWRSSASWASSTSPRSSTWPTVSSAASATTGLLLQILLFRDAAIRLPHHPDGGAGGDAGRRRVADQEQRADRDAGVRRQPLSVGGSAAAVRRCCSAASCTRCRRTCWPTRNRRAEATLHVMRGFPAQTFGVLSTEAGSSGRRATSTTTRYFDPARNCSIA